MITRIGGQIESGATYQMALRVALATGDAVLAADAHAALRRLGQRPALPRRPRRVKATVKGRAAIFEGR